jgi:hypothetical protein
VGVDRKIRSRFPPKTFTPNCTPFPHTTKLCKDFPETPLNATIQYNGLREPMTYRGRIERGVVVLDERPPLPDGTIVEVVPVSTNPVGQALEKLAGTAQNLPPDLAQRHDHHRREHNG